MKLFSFLNHQGSYSFLCSPAPDMLNSNVNNLRPNLIFHYAYYLPMINFWEGITWSYFLLKKSPREVTHFVLPCTGTCSIQTIITFVSNLIFHYAYYFPLIKYLGGITWCYFYIKIQRRSYPFCAPLHWTCSIQTLKIPPQLNISLRLLFSCD